MAIKLEISENLSSYKEDLENDINSIETELNSINISLNSIPKHQIIKIEDHFSQCENNVNY
jgi:hypothetical protein